MIRTLNIDWWCLFFRAKTFGGSECTRKTSRNVITIEKSDITSLAEREWDEKLLLPSLAPKLSKCTSINLQYFLELVVSLHFIRVKLILFMWFFQEFAVFGSNLSFFGLFMIQLLKDISNDNYFKINFLDRSQIIINVANNNRNDSVVIWRDK